MFTINLIGSNFIIRESGQLQYEIIEGEDLLEGSDNILYDQTIRLSGLQTRKNTLTCSDMSAITLWNTKELPLILLTTLESALNMLRCFIKIDGKWNCSLSGLSSICI